MLQNQCFCNQINQLLSPTKYLSMLKYVLSSDTTRRKLIKTEGDFLIL